MMPRPLTVLDGRLVGFSVAAMVQAAQTMGRKDPTRTSTVRRDFEREFAKRLRKLRAKIIEMVGDRDELAVNKRFEFTTDQAKIAAFRSWLEDEINRQLFDGSLSDSYDRAADRWWGKTFVNIAYRRGLLNAVNAIKRAGGTVADSYIMGAMTRGQHVEVLDKIYTRAFDQLRGISTEMSNQIGQVLAEGLAGGRHSSQIAEDLADRVDKIGITRARLIARTEVISAYNEAELNSFEDAGLEGVLIEPEWVTAGDSQVCPKCEEASRRSYTIQEARGLIPLHPNCRCAWAPLIKDGKGITLS